MFNLEYLDSRVFTLYSNRYKSGGYVGLDCTTDFDVDTNIVASIARRSVPGCAGFLELPSVCPRK